MKGFTCDGGAVGRWLAGCCCGAEEVVVSSSILPVHRHVDDGIDARRQVNKNVGDQMHICKLPTTLPVNYPSKG